MKHWHIIKTKPHKEASVVGLLKTADINGFCPYIQEMTHRSHSRYLITKPLFPSYIFVFIDFKDEKNWHNIKYTRGVSKILCAENKPLVLDIKIVNAIQSRCDEKGHIKKTSPFIKGDTIKVKKGMLRDLIGIIEKPASDEERIMVLFKMANLRVKAALHWTEVEKIKAA